MRPWLFGVWPYFNSYHGPQYAHPPDRLFVRVVVDVASTSGPFLEPTRLASDNNHPPSPGISSLVIGPGSAHSALRRRNTRLSAPHTPRYKQSPMAERSRMKEMRGGAEKSGEAGGGDKKQYVNWG